MKIIFFGTSEFALPVLEALVSSKEKILKVVTAPDKKKGRGQKIAFSPVKILAQEKNLSILQPTDLKDTGFLQSLKKGVADLFVVCAYGRILTRELLQIPKKYAINLHASLLPKYRGAAPINWAIIRGETRTGITIFKMDEYMDRGEIILQQKIDISYLDTSVRLGIKLSRIGAELLLKAVDLIKSGAETFTEQDETQATFAPKLKKKDGLIDWNMPALDIYNRVRGLQPWPGAFTYLNNKLLKIWNSQVVRNGKDRQPGEIVNIDTEKGILVQTGKDKLLITVLQLEGKRKMLTAEFISGHRIEIGSKLK